jgi:homoserine O-acetyltransferase
MEWALLEPGVFDHLILIATNANHSPYGIAFNEAQRLAIEADGTWKEDDARAGIDGLKAARAIGMLSYRSAEGFEERQSEKTSGKLDDFRAASYQRHQGQKLATRFNAFTYWTLSKAMDSHNIGRSRGSIESVLRTIKARTLVVGIQTDILFPFSEQKLLAANIQGATLDIIHSLYGHDGFLVEFDQLRGIIRKFYRNENKNILV